MRYRFNVFLLFSCFLFEAFASIVSPQVQNIDYSVSVRRYLDLIFLRDFIYGIVCACVSQSHLNEC